MDRVPVPPCFKPVRCPRGHVNAEGQTPEVLGPFWCQMGRGHTGECVGCPYCVWESLSSVLRRVTEAEDALVALAKRVETLESRPVYCSCTVCDPTPESGQVY